MTALPANTIARPYRGVSVQRVPTLEPDALVRHVRARPVYRRTDFIVATSEGRHALVRVARADGDGILVPVRDAEVVATADEVAFIADEAIDVGIASQLAAAARASGRAARVYVVEGRFQHVNFIVDPRPLPVRVVEVVPPEPPKLLELARDVVAFDDELPPLALELVPIDLRATIAAHPAERHLLPCRSGGLDDLPSVDFLDDGPAAAAWTLVGCERSRQIHRALYGRDAAADVDICPRVRVPADDRATLTRCCLLERGIERERAHVRVPWGAEVDEVRTALRLLAGLPAAPTPVEVRG